ncbi:MAG TPA: DUF4080 domain-containing protein [Candidatus Hydrogenedentes bacterium]|nr:DUF4080 domain-containing protein [Candidatus Hydrogenedentota bacterium]HPG67635.1 DUF4080 domain-containing protein [Candidatus Hydrogenedentota bacterium]
MDRTEIVLATANARYSHAAFGLRYLLANLGPLRDRATILESTIDQRPQDIVESILSLGPRVVGLGVYIWNVALMTDVVKTLKAVRPDVVIIIGGPEVGYEYEDTILYEAADYLVRGEGEGVFAQLTEAILDGRRPEPKVREAAPMDPAALTLPYDAYSDEDLAHRLTYVEASRGCPFRCAFCLSSIEGPVRYFPLDPLLDEVGTLIERGARRFKFVDRTFNIDEQRVEHVMRFFIEHWRDGMQVHFEIVPDLLTERMIEAMEPFPEAGLRLEVGIQTFNPDVHAAIARVQNLAKTEDNIRLVRSRTGAVIHVDLIAGLPGESIECFGVGFDRTLALEPHEIQVGILRRLKGTAIAKNAAADGLVFAPYPPYEILQNRLLGFDDIQRLKRFARIVDLYHNAGRFPRSLPLLLQSCASPFDTLIGLSDFVWNTTGRVHELSLSKRVELLRDYAAERGVPAAEMARALEEDYTAKPGRKDKLTFNPPSG